MVFLMGSALEVSAFNLSDSYIIFPRANGEPLFSSHMLDLSEEFDEENIATCVKYFKVLWSCPSNCTNNVMLTLYFFTFVVETSQEDQFCRNTAFVTV